MTPTPGLRRLLEELDSFEKLELVLYLRAAGRAMSIDEFALALQIGTDVTRRLVTDLSASRVVEVDAETGAVTLRATPAQLARIDEAAQVHGRDRTALATLMSRIAMDRLRALSARTFAEAAARSRGTKGDDER